MFVWVLLQVQALARTFFVLAGVCFLFVLRTSCIVVVLGTSALAPLGSVIILMLIVVGFLLGWRLVVRSHHDNAGKNNSSLRLLEFLFF